MGLELQKTIPDRRYETVIVGLGETGISVANYLQAQSIPFIVVDSRNEPPQLHSFKESFPQVDIILGELSKDTFKFARQIIVSPGIDVGDPIFKSIANDGINCIGDIELFARSANKPIISITGSNGKSTVTSLVAAMASASNVKAYAGGNLAPPALDLLKHIDAEVYVLELSSFQLESTFSLRSEVSAVLNISPDHLDRHGNIDEYASIKEKIYIGAKNSVVNRDDPYVSKMKVEGRIITFGLECPIDKNFGLTKYDGDIYLAQGEELLCKTNKIAMYGRVGVLNALAALAIGYSMGLPRENMIETLTTFKGLPHRLSYVKNLHGVSWFNDSKGTNIGAAISSIQSLGNNIILLAGGVYKGGDLNLLRSVVSKYVKSVILFGQDASLIKDALYEVVEIEKVQSMQEAVFAANEKAVSGDSVLLSPACASLDMYSNYIERGDDFESCVRRLK